MLQVDDVLFVGKRKFWEEQFLPKLREKFTVSASVLEGEGSSISFLKRKLVKVERGLALVPGTNIDKLVENFVTHFGQVRIQHVTCDASIQLPDVSSNLTSRDAYAYRSAVGGLLYLARDRPADLVLRQGVVSKDGSTNCDSVAKAQESHGVCQGYFILCSGHRRT
jgi:hypothetical protein